MKPMNKSYQNIYGQTTAKSRLDNPVSDVFPKTEESDKAIRFFVRRQTSPKESMQMEKTLQTLQTRFADDVVLFDENTKQI